MKNSDIELSLILGALFFAVIGAFCDVLSAKESVGFLLGVVAVLGILPQLKKLN